MKNFNRLARYYHTVIPLLRDVMQLPEPPEPESAEAAGNAAEAVAVELCEVPADEAGVLVAAREKSVEKKICADVAAGKLECFVEKNGLYRSRLTIVQLMGILAFLPVWAVVSFGPLVFDVEMPLPFRLGPLVFMGVLLYFLARESLFIRLDPRRRTISAFICFGLRKREFPVGRVEKLTLKHIGPLKALCVVLEGMKVDSAVTETLSLRKVKTAMREFGDILGVDATRLLDV